MYMNFSGLWWCQPAPPRRCVPGQGPLWTDLLQPGQHVCPQNTSGKKKEEQECCDRGDYFEWNIFNIRDLEN